MLIGISLSVLYDSLFYGKFVSTHYNFLIFNALKNYSSLYGVTPFYQYLLIIPYAFTGNTLLLLASLVYMKKNKNQSVLIFLIGNLLINSLSAHKE